MLGSTKQMIRNEYQTDSASFRDPNGAVIIRGIDIYRSIFPSGLADFKSATENGIFELLIEKKLLIDHVETEPDDYLPHDTVVSIKHPKIPVITYPWEWPFSMLKDAALLHLDIMSLIVKKGFWLRDANAFNVQYYQGSPVLIDTLSVGQRKPDYPWVAYQQFCMQFLAPLALMSHLGSKITPMWLAYPNGFPLDVAAKSLPFKKKLNFGILMHLVLHSKFQQNTSISKNYSQKKVTLSDKNLLALISSLRNTINKLELNENNQHWRNYINTRTYNDSELKDKISFVENIVSKNKFNTVWDVGGNTGEFSELIAKYSDTVLSIDYDGACTEYLYNKIRSGKASSAILPLNIDFSHPSPALGWDNSERKSLFQRSTPDFILALALIHHLVLSANVPIYKVAELLSRLSKNLIIEYVPEDDPMVVNMLRFRVDKHLPYTQELFESCFETFYKCEQKTKLSNGRILYFYTR